jgi:hypothetical protein
MRSLLVIPLLVACVFGIAMIALSLAGFAAKAQDAITAGIIAAAAGMIGLLPILRARRVELVASAQAALAGTALHLMTQVALAAGVIACHHGGIAFRELSVGGAFAMWLLLGYWTSLAALSWQLRRVILGITNPAKVTE